VLERGVVYSKFVIVNSSVEVPFVSCVDVLEILLREGGDVELWLEPQNISWCLHLIHYL